MNRYDWGFRLLPPLIKASAIQKVDAARSALIEHRARGLGPGDDDSVVRQFDLAGLNEFWEVELSEPIDCDGFAWRLSIHFFSVSSSTDEGIARANILSALRTARTDGEPWFIAKHVAPISDNDAVPRGMDLSSLRISPRDAAEWMLSKPKRRHLLPGSLAAFLSGVWMPIGSASSVEPKRGRRPVAGARVRAEMRTAIQRGIDLSTYTEEALAAEFGASRDTCRKARAEVSSPHVEN